MAASTFAAGAWTRGLHTGVYRRPLVLQRPPTERVTDAVVDLDLPETNEYPPEFLHEQPTMSLSRKRQRHFMEHREAAGEEVYAIPTPVFTLPPPVPPTAEPRAARPKPPPNPPAVSIHLLEPMTADPARRLAGVLLGCTAVTFAIGLLSLVTDARLLRILFGFSVVAFFVIAEVLGIHVLRRK